jgi:hypothetical protein
MDTQVLSGRPLARLCQQGRGEINAGHIAAPACSRERAIAMTRSHVEHAMVGAQVDRFAQELAHDDEPRSDQGIVPGGPARLLLGFECGTSAHVILLQ